MTTTVRTLFFAAATTVFLGGSAHAEGLGVTLRAGTTGLGVDLTARLAPLLNLRVGGSLFTYSHDIDENGINYDSDLRLKSGSALLDFYALDGFRLSGGLFLNKNELRAVATPQATYPIGNRDYPAAAVGELSGLIDFKSVAPYAGIGFGNVVGKGRRMTVTLDLGVLFQGEPQVHLSADGLLASDPAFQADLLREEAGLNEDLSGFRFYPVLNLGLGFQF